jgi:hypothetical protein
MFFVSDNDELIKRRNLRQYVAINTFEFSKDEIPKSFRSCIIEYCKIIITEEITDYDLLFPKEIVSKSDIYIYYQQYRKYLN